mmetsp:Transcript_79072/g.209973  ORF Transcript_79072/g.209973 Transcript_79072/m.209973 type:complete len:87 (-) Transcript_79072:228-488(-)
MAYWLMKLGGGGTAGSDFVAMAGGGACAITGMLANVGAVGGTIRPVETAPKVATLWCTACDGERSRGPVAGMTMLRVAPKVCPGCS